MQAGRGAALGPQFASATGERLFAHAAPRCCGSLPQSRLETSQTNRNIRAVQQSEGEAVLPQSATEVDILIVGAGPVGLFLANECARRGLRWRLVEARSSQSAHSKALAIFPRTLEMFDMAGL